MAAVNFFAPKEVGRLLEHAPGALERAFWLCGAHAGLRLPGEAQGLRWGAVDFDAGVIRVYDNWVRNAADGTKTSDSAPIPMTPQLRDALQALRDLSLRTGQRSRVSERARRPSGV
jgi:integrase